MIIGIDLGTTNSLAAIFEDGAPRIIPNALGEDMTPSVVSLSGDGTLLVGRAAKDRLVTHPEQTASVFKRAMGTDQTFQLGRKVFRAEELSALVLRSLVADVESHCGQAVTEAVVSVPAYFNETQRKATLQAAQLAELKVERLINEPTAAALAYGLHSLAEDSEEELNFLVFDLGGGTFDVSVLELFEGTMEIHASAGEAFLGGEDFTQAIAKDMVSKQGKSLNDLSEPDQARLIELADSAKCRLMRDKPVDLRFQPSGQGEPWAYRLDSENFQVLAAPLIRRLEAPLRKAMNDARLKPENLDRLLLVGGATRMPFIRRLVGSLFRKFPQMALDPDRVVALGVAVQAGLKARDSALKEVVLTDVCPHSLGVAVRNELNEGEFLDGVFSPIIERNTTVPVSRMNTLCTTVDGQSYVSLHIYQGEARLVRDNIKLGEMRMPLPPNAKKGMLLEVRFTYDINGLLEIDAENSEGTRRSMVIEQRPGTLDAQEIRTRLAALSKLKIHPRDKAVNAALVARGERLFASLLGKERVALGEAMGRFDLVLQSQDDRAIDAKRLEVSSLLDALEDKRF